MKDHTQNTNLRLCCQIGAYLELFNISFQFMLTRAAELEGQMHPGPLARDKWGKNACPIEAMQSKNTDGIGANQRK